LFLSKPALHCKKSLVVIGRLCAGDPLYFSAVTIGRVCVLFYFYDFSFVVLLLLPLLLSYYGIATKSETKNTTLLETMFMAMTSV
jgi:hypothetical protein